MGTFVHRLSRAAKTPLHALARARRNRISPALD